MGFSLWIFMDHGLKNFLGKNTKIWIIKKNDRLYFNNQIYING